MVIKNIVLCILGTIGFCVVLNVPRSKVFLVIAGAIISASSFEILFEYSRVGIFGSTLFAVMLIEIYSEAVARIFKAPASIILIPSTVPLLPGGYLYYAMSYLVVGQIKEFVENAKNTLLVAFAIALGSILTLIMLDMIRRIKAVLH